MRIAAAYEPPLPASSHFGLTPPFVGDLLTAEISEKQARSIKYQITIAKMPLAKDLQDFAFDGTPVNETLVRELAGGDFLFHQRNLVLVGGTEIAS